MHAKHVKSAASHLWPRKLAPRVIHYHSVHPGQDLSIRPALLAEHLDWLLASGFEVVTFSELLRCVQAGESAAKLVGLTFDDGYVDNYEYALPLLMERRIPASFFVVTGMISDSAPISSNSGNHLYKDRWILTKSQLREMHAYGFEIGSHTRSHINVRRAQRESEAEVIAELWGSRMDLEDCLGTEITSFAYPFGQKGFYDELTATQVRAAGYKYAAVTIWGSVDSRTNPLEIPRLEIRHDDSLDNFQRKVMGHYDYLRYYQLAFDRSTVWER